MSQLFISVQYKTVFSHPVFMVAHLTYFNAMAIIRGYIGSVFEL
jgi:hypothetical protein